MGRLQGLVRPREGRRAWAAWAVTWGGFDWCCLWEPCGEHPILRCGYKWVLCGGWGHVCACRTAVLGLLGLRLLGLRLVRTQPGWLGFAVCRQKTVYVPPQAHAQCTIRCSWQSCSSVPCTHEQRIFYTAPTAYLSRLSRPVRRPAAAVIHGSSVGAQRFLPEASQPILARCWALPSALPKAHSALSSRAGCRSRKGAQRR